MEMLDEAIAEVTILGHKLAEQHGSKDLQRRLADARQCQYTMEYCLRNLQKACEFTKISLKLRAEVPLPATCGNKHLCRRSTSELRGIRQVCACLASGKAATTKQAAIPHK